MVKKKEKSIKIEKTGNSLSAIHKIDKTVPGLYGLWWPVVPGKRTHD